MTAHGSKQGSAGNNQGPSSVDFDLREIFQLLWARKNILIATLATALILAFFSIWFATPLYTARATLEVNRYAPDILNFRDVVGVDPMAFREFTETQSRIMESRSVMEIASKHLALADRPEVFQRTPTPLQRFKSTIASWFKPEGKESEPIDWESVAVDYLASRTSVSAVRNAMLLNISFTDRNPEFAAEATDAISRAFQEYNLASRYQISDQASEFLTKEVARIQGEIANLERKLQELGDERKIVALSSGTQDISERALADLHERLTLARSERAIRKAKLQELKQTPPEGIAEVLNSPLIQNLRQQYAELERRITQMEERFKPGWPALAQAKEELNQAGTRLDQETERIASQVTAVAQADYDQADSEVKNLESEVNQQKSEVRRVNRDAIDYAGLKAEIETRRKVLTDLVTRQSETETTGQLRDARASNIRIVERAEIPLVPSYPRKKLTLALALFMGLGLGVGLALLLHTIDNTVKSDQDIRQYGNDVAILGHVPTFDHLRAVGKEEVPEAQGPPLADLASHSYPNSPFAEAFKNLRTTLLLASPGRPARTILITSAQPGDGKSTAAINLATTFAQLGRKVLLIDADLRKPRLNRTFKNINEVGLSSFLAGTTDISSLIQGTEVPNLSTIFSGPVPPNPSELLDSSGLETLLQHESLATYDHIFLDAPPAIQVADSMILAPRMDATLLIVRANLTTRESLQSAIQKLDQARAKVIGVVLNDIHSKSGSYRYGYYGSAPNVIGGKLASLQDRFKRGNREAG